MASLSSPYSLAFSTATAACAARNLRKPARAGLKAAVAELFSRYKTPTRRPRCNIGTHNTDFGLRRTRYGSWEKRGSLGASGKIVACPVRAAYCTIGADSSSLPSTGCKIPIRTRSGSIVMLASISSLPARSRTKKPR